MSDYTPKNIINSRVCTQRCILFRTKRETQEASERSSDPGPSQFTREHLEEFSINSYYAHLLENFPTLVHTLAATMMSHQGPDEIKVREKDPIYRSHAIVRIPIDTASVAVRLVPRSA